ncbi:hypothetical protein [Sphingomonas faeni]|uniref:hypothetical protein n=1 Tax=Sphingomonas faeni TaxID=185950 RepID=UPI0020BD55FC|nr:hypothetical protein [Sphingomonas faeni]MCK8457041.1 hypothetical protein [Sphingomonas faeni]
MTDWNAATWRASFLAVGGTLTLHDGELIAGWRLDNPEQDRAAADVFREIYDNPARFAIVRKMVEAVDRIYPNADAFDATAWLRSLAAIGGGYALGAGRLWLIVHECDWIALGDVMRPLIGHPERVEAVRATVAALQLHEAEAPS